MGQGAKKLVLKELSARLPYGVKCKISGEDVPRELSGIDVDYEGGHLFRFAVPDSLPIEVYTSEVKPYLRTLDSMTEEEKGELSKKFLWYISCGEIKISYRSEGYWDTDTDCDFSDYMWLERWLLKHHFDYRGPN